MIYNYVEYTSLDYGAKSKETENLINILIIPRRIFANAIWTQYYAERLELF